MLGPLDPRTVREKTIYVPYTRLRRVFEKDGRRATPPLLNAHLFHALAVAMILAGLGGMFVARRW